MQSHLQPTVSRRHTSESFSRSLGEAELRQRQRILMLHRSEAASHRMRRLRDHEAFQRRLAGEVRERRHQQTRCRQIYYDHAVKFREQKLARCAEEERVSSSF